METDQPKIPPTKSDDKASERLFSWPGIVLARNSDGRPIADAGESLPTDLERLLAVSIAKVREEKFYGHAPVVTPAIQGDALPDGLVAKLKAPLPAEAITPHPTKPWLSSIKPAFVIERLNDVFGPGGWQERYEFVDSYRFTKCVKDPNGSPGSTREVAATMIIVESSAVGSARPRAF